MFTKSQMCVILLILANDCLQIGGNRNFRVYYTNVSTKSLSDEMKLNSTIDKTIGSISLYINVLTNILKPYINALAYTDSGNGLYQLELFNRTINACMFFGNKRYEPLLQIGYKMLRKERGVDIPSRCPIAKKLYSIKNMVINSAMLPPVMPEKKAFIKLTFLSKDDTILKELGTHAGYIRIEKIRHPKFHK